VNITQQAVICFVVIVAVIVIAKNKGLFKKEAWVTDDPIYGEIDKELDAKERAESKND
jgi:hypothetical protein